MDPLQPTARRTSRRRWHRVRRWVLRVGAAVTVLLVCGAAASFRWGVGRGIWRAGEYATLVIERGAVTYEVQGPSLMRWGGVAHWFIYNAWNTRAAAQEDPMGLRGRLGWLPVWAGARGHQRRLVSLPLWIPVAAVAVPTLLGARRARRREALGACPSCGYCLAGLGAAVPCPECGELLN